MNPVTFWRILCFPPGCLPAVIWPFCKNIYFSISLCHLTSNVLTLVLYFCLPLVVLVVALGFLVLPLVAECKHQNAKQKSMEKPKQTGKMLSALMLIMKNILLGKNMWHAHAPPCFISRKKNMKCNRHSLLISHTKPFQILLLSGQCIWLRLVQSTTNISWAEGHSLAVVCQWRNCNNK